MTSTPTKKELKSEKRRKTNIEQKQETNKRDAEKIKKQRQYGGRQRETEGRTDKKRRWRGVITATVQPRPTVRRPHGEGQQEGAIGRREEEESSSFRSGVGVVRVAV
jgi:hypothetical protein